MRLGRGALSQARELDSDKETTLRSMGEQIEGEPVERRIIQSGGSCMVNPIENHSQHLLRLILNLVL